MRIDFNDLRRLMGRSTWRMMNSIGGQAGAGPIAVAGGVLDFKDTSVLNAPANRLRYSALGLGASFGVEFGISGSLPESTSPNIIYTLPASGGRLTLNDFRGHFTAFDIGANGGITGSVTVFLLGANNTAARLMNLIPGMTNMFNPAILALHKAFFVTAGLGVSLTPSAGATVFSGEVGL